MIAMRSFVATIVVRKLMLCTSPSSSPMVMRSPIRIGRSKSRIKPDAMSAAMYCKKADADRQRGKDHGNGREVDRKRLFECYQRSDGDNYIFDQPADCVTQTGIDMSPVRNPALDQGTGPACNQDCEDYYNQPDNDTRYRNRNPAKGELPRQVAPNLRDYCCRILQ